MEDDISRAFITIPPFCRNSSMKRRDTLFIMVFYCCFVEEVWYNHFRRGDSRFVHTMELATHSIQIAQGFRDEYDNS